MIYIVYKNHKGSRENPTAFIMESTITIRNFNLSIFTELYPAYALQPQGWRQTLPS